MNVNVINMVHALFMPKIYTAFYYFYYLFLVEFLVLGQQNTKSRNLGILPSR